MDCCPGSEKFSRGEVLERHPLCVLLMVVLGFHLAFVDLLNELGWTLNVVINQESEVKSRRLFQALNQDAAHRINIQVTCWASRRWDGSREYNVYPVTLGMISFKSPRRQ